MAKIEIDEWEKAKKFEEHRNAALKDTKMSGKKIKKPLCTSVG